MKKYKLLMLFFMIVIFGSFGTGVLALTYNGSSGSYGGNNSSSSCVKGSFCNNKNFKALAITLYYIPDKGEMKKVSGTETIVVNNGKRGAPSKNCEGFCTQKSWFTSSDYGYNSSAISESIGGGDPNKVNDLRIKKIAKWISRLYGENLTFKTTSKAREYVSGKLKNASCEVTKVKNHKGDCANSYGYRIIVEPVVGYLTKGGSYTTGKLKSVVNKGIGSGSGSKNIYARLMSISFKDVGVKYKSRTSCSYSNLGDFNSGCGWNIIDPSFAIKKECGTYKDRVFYKNSYKKSGKYYDKNGSQIKYNTTQKKYKISATGEFVDAKGLKSYLEGKCPNKVKKNPKCEEENGKYYDKNGKETNKETYVKQCVPPAKKCSYNSSTETWYDNGGNAHEEVPSNRIMSWIKRGCPSDTINASINCKDCDSEDSSGLAFSYNELNNDWKTIAASYHGNEDGEDAINSYFSKDVDQSTTDSEDDDSNNGTVDETGEVLDSEGDEATDEVPEVDLLENDKIYCKQSYNVYLPNKKTVNLKSVKAGRYITVNLANSKDLLNLEPLKIEKNMECIVIDDSTSMAEANSTASLPPQASDSQGKLQSYFNSLDSEDDLGSISISYKMGNYKDITADLVVNRVNKSKSTSKSDGYDVMTQTQSVYYSLPDNFYRYYRNKDGLGIKDKPQSNLTKYTDLGISTLPVPYSDVSGEIKFTYKPSGSVTDMINENDSLFNISGNKSCFNNNYVCKLSEGKSCDVITDPKTDRVIRYGKNGDEVDEDDFNKQCNKCYLQKTNDGYDYYVNGNAVSESEYVKVCPCDEVKDKVSGEVTYKIGDQEVDKEKYDAVCPTCDRSCPTGEVCCWDSNMSCSVNGNCPTGGRKLIYRTIDLKDPFPGQNNTNIQLGRKTGTNWCTYNWREQKLNCNNQNNSNTSSSDENVIVSKHIKQNAGASGEDVYKETPQYSFTLDSNSIDKIREYNSTQKKNDDGYDDFTLNCFDVAKDTLEENGIYSSRICVSTFFRNGTGGTNNNQGAIIEQNGGTNTNGTSGSKCSSDDIGTIALCSEGSGK